MFQWAEQNYYLFIAGRCGFIFGYFHIFHPLHFVIFAIAHNIHYCAKNATILLATKCYHCTGEGHKPQTDSDAAVYHHYLSVCAFTLGINYEAVKFSRAQSYF